MTVALRSLAPYAQTLDGTPLPPYGYQERASAGAQALAAQALRLVQISDLPSSGGGGGGGGGATAFVDLTDAPESITATALLVGNADGDALTFTQSITETDTGNVYIQTPVDRSVVVEAGSSAELKAVDAFGAVLVRGGAGGTVEIEATGVDAFLDIKGTGGGDIGLSSSGDLWVDAASNVIFGSLPTSDPAVAGALWNDAGTLKISAG